jgi:5-formaminoimidazole-4-carboxamide-1-(beta)-D-ribofuranosyl 5'-monophosphate synthetase
MPLDRPKKKFITLLSKWLCMIKGEEIREVINKYKDPAIGVLGSHSALEIAHGARQEGLKTVIICQKGREEVYSKHYRNLFDEIIILDSFSEMADDGVQEQLRKLNTIFVPSRSFSVYLGYDSIENDLIIPLMGNRWMLRMEERTASPNQYDLLHAAGIKVPRIFDTAEDVDRLAIVKVMEKDGIERAFFLSSNPDELREKSDEMIDKGLIDSKDLGEATIEEYVLGAKFNANFFWSPLTGELDLLGFDRRIQTNYDGYMDLPAKEQLDLDLTIRNIEIGHYGATMRESQIAKIFNAGERFADATKKDVPPGMIGLFALQGAVDKNLDFFVFDLSPRIPGCPCVEPTSPYMKYKYGHSVGPGRRVAMEIKKSVREGRVADIVS